MAKKKKDVIKAPAERISYIAEQWFLAEPLLFSLYCTHRLRENNDMQVPMRCGQGVIEYNSKLCSELSEKELRSRIKVEVLRIMLKHPYQRQPFRPRLELLTIASNLAIIEAMGGPHTFDFELVPDYLYQDMPKGRTFEEYYLLLNRMFPPTLDFEKDDEQKGDNTDTAESHGNNDENDKNENFNKDLDTGQNKNKKEDKTESGKLIQSMRDMIQCSELWQEDGVMVVDINLQISAVLASQSDKYGTLPASFIEIVKASFVPQVNIANILKRFKKTIISQHRNLTRMRPSRRYGFEQMGSRYAYTTNVLVALDVSGSVDSYAMSMMLGLINRLFKQGVQYIDVLQFDSKITVEPKPIRKAIKTFEILGRGYTDFQPAADYYCLHTEYDGLIYITDGKASNPEISGQHQLRPVTWIIIGETLIPSIEYGWNRK